MREGNDDIPYGSRADPLLVRHETDRRSTQVPPGLRSSQLMGAQIPVLVSQLKHSGHIFLVHSADWRQLRSLQQLAVKSDVSNKVDWNPPVNSHHSQERSKMLYDLSRLTPLKSRKYGSLGNERGGW
jgi:hypothetical protein